MTCASCRHSIGTERGLWCQLLRHIALGRCGRFSYEPGTDEQA